MKLIENYIDLPGKSRKIIEPLISIVKDRGLRFIVTNIPQRPWPSIYVDFVGKLEEKQLDQIIKEFEPIADIFGGIKQYDSNKVIYAHYLLTKNQVNIEMTYLPDKRDHMDLRHYVETGEIIPKKLLEF